MKKKAIIIFLMLCCVTVTSYSQQKISNVTYVDKTWFLIKTGDKKIFIDAAFKGIDDNYKFKHEVQEKFTKAQAPFDGIDLILVTHPLGGHISTSMVEQHLQNNLKAIFASTEENVNMLNNFPDRYVIFNPTKDNPVSKVINDITIEAFYFPKSTEAQFSKYGFVVLLDGKTLFQTSHFEKEIYDKGIADK